MYYFRKYKYVVPFEIYKYIAGSIPYFNNNNWGVL